MIPLKKALVALLISGFVMIQIQPALDLPSHGITFSPMIGVASQNVTTTQVSVYAPQGSLANSMLSSFLSTLGISLSSFGSLSTFNMPQQYSGRIISELNNLESNSGLHYYINNATAVAYPSLSFSPVTPSQQTPSEYFPNNIANAYNFTYPLTHNLTGKGTTIAIVDGYGSPSIKYDIRAFDNTTGLPPVNLSIVYPNNVHPTSYNSSWSIETSTDVEWAHALAPGANIMLVVAKDANVSSLDTAVSYVIANHLANIISLSWGIPENHLSTAGFNTFSAVYKQAAQEGITVLAATGDYGAYDQQSQLTVNFPSSDPYVTAIGGTSLYVYNNEYSQKAWGGELNGNVYGGGGGYSAYFKTPWWQKAPGFGSAYRGIPDVSMDANKDTGMFVISQGKDYKIGGTSIGTPIWADVVSLMDQATGHSLGFVNPLLYQISSTPAYSKSFTDITAGNNGYYNATPGWDAATGIGTPLVGDLVNSTLRIYEPYGSNALVYGAGYNSTGISSQLKLHGDPSSETQNGSTFYYLASYYNQNNYVKAGVEVNNTTVSQGYMVAQDGIVYENFTPVTPFTATTLSYKLNLSVDGQFVNYTVGGSSFSLKMFLKNAGRSSLAFGAEQIGSMTNMTVIPGASFLNVTLYNNGTMSQPQSVYESHFSGPGYPGYSTIQITDLSGTNYSVSYSSMSPDTVLTPAASSSPQIVYSLSFSTPVQANFNLANFSGSATWYVNGSLMGGTGGNHTSFAYGGTYYIKAETSGITPTTIKRTITIPAVAESNITATSTIPYDSTPSYSVLLDHFYRYTGSGTITVPSLQSGNTLELTSHGFNSEKSSFGSGSNITIPLVARNVSVSIFTYPENATVMINGNSVPSDSGMHKASISPREINVSVSYQGYTGTSGQYRLYPGQNFTRQDIIAPTNITEYATVSGNVTDGIYSFPIGGVNVSLGGLPLVFTNSTGYFVVYFKTGKYNVSYTSPLYLQKSIILNLTDTTNRTMGVTLYPKNINITSLPQVNINRIFPLLFYFGYISWTAYTGSGFGAYQIYISTTQDMSSFRTMTIGGQNSTFAFVSGIVPGQKYYVKVTVNLNDGEVYSSPVVTLSYSNPLVLLANFAIVIGIAAYAVMAVRFIGRMRRKRTIRL